MQLLKGVNFLIKTMLYATNSSGMLKQMPKTFTNTKLQMLA